MAQLITLLILVCAAWWLYRRFVSDAQKLAERSRRAQKERQTGAIGTLVKDPATGEYRLKREDE
jgi:membrane protein implicated in regulation of membrane protease activity